MADAGDHDVVLPRDGPRVEGRGLRDQVREDRVGLPGRDGDDAFVVIADDIEAEAKPGATGDLAHGLVERIAFHLRQADVRVLEEAHAVRRGDHRFAAAADRDGLAATRVARVLVRLDDPGRDDQIGLLDELLRRLERACTWS